MLVFSPAPVLAAGRASLVVCLKAGGSIADLAAYVTRVLPACAGAESAISGLAAVAGDDAGQVGFVEVRRDRRLPQGLQQHQSQTPLLSLLIHRH